MEGPGGHPYEFHVLTLFPNMIREAVAHSVLGRAVESGAVVVRVHDIRDHADDRHRTVDDEPYGGGPGMVMKVEPLVRCLDKVRAEAHGELRSYLMSASGIRFDQPLADGLSREAGVILVCGHYEGVDERVAEGYVDGELSVGDYVLSGGELPALTVVDAVARLLPGVLGNRDSLVEESHRSGVLEYPQYTRPAEFDGARVPDVLLSGNHAAISEYRRLKALEKTRRNRPDLAPPPEDADDDEHRPPVLGRPPEKR